jgi:predicted HTH transcriptional regulator
VIRNAIVHRDYSLTGKDIKVAIYDDMVEITSPGKLMPSIDYDDRESGQSDVRNKVIAPIFKKFGIIDQWGNGLKLIDEELKLYRNEIEFLWRDTGTQFQVHFVKKQIKERVKETDTRSVVVKSSNDELIQLIGTKLTPSWHQVGIKLEITSGHIRNMY